MYVCMYNLPSRSMDLPYINGLDQNELKMLEKSGICFVVNDFQALCSDRTHSSNI